MKIGYAIVAICAFDIEHEKLQPVMETLSNMPDIHWIYTVSGRFDIMACIWSTSTDELYMQLHEIGKIEGVKNIETFICLHNGKSRSLFSE